MHEGFLNPCCAIQEILISGQPARGMGSVSHVSHRGAEIGCGLQWGCVEAASKKCGLRGLECMSDSQFGAKTVGWLRAEG